MEIKRFGNIEGKTMMLLHGNLMCWQQFENLIPLLERKFCVYAVSFDGFDGTGETTYTTARDQADKLAAYIEKELDGQLDLLFAESLGCGPAVFLKASPTVQIDRMILSGPEYLDFGVLNRLILKVMPQKQYRTAHEKYMPAWALRFMGQTEQGMQTMLRRIPDHISLESVRATWEAGLYLYRTDFLVQPDAKVACWYGEKEGHMKKAIQRLFLASCQVRRRLDENAARKAPIWRWTMDVSKDKNAIVAGMVGCLLSAPGDFLFAANSRSLSFICLRHS